MGCARNSQLRQRFFGRSLGAIATFVLLAATFWAQDTPAARATKAQPANTQTPETQPPSTPSSSAHPATAQPPATEPGKTPATPSTAGPKDGLAETLNKYPGLLEELERLLEKLRQGVQYPAARKDSRLLPLLPDTTMSYAAFSNYGDALHQAVNIFRQELRDSSPLRDWWEQGEQKVSGPKMLDSLDRFAQLHQFLGEEIVVAGVLQDGQVKPLIVAEARKPGLKKELLDWMKQFPEQSNAGMRILDSQELEGAKDKNTKNDLLVVVRPDFVIASTNVETLRNFNRQMTQGKRDFAATAFGQRVAKEYGNGVTVLAAADLQKILSQVPTAAKPNQLALQRSGFADATYLVWEHTTNAGQAVSEGELSFSGPRHGAAAWLASPAPLGSMDFVSPKAIMAATVVLTDPAQIFEDGKALAGPDNANAFAALAQGEQALKLSLRDDLLKHLGGEVTIELDSVAAPKPLWKVIVKVDAAEHIQKTLSTLFAVAHYPLTQAEDAGVTYYRVTIPAQKNPTEIDYAFVDGYLVEASNREAVAEAVQLHASGESLGKSKKFLAALPPGHGLEASALLYEDSSAMAAMQMQRLGPEVAKLLASSSREVPPTVVGLYGEESAIRSASSNGGLDFGGVMIGAAIAIPNLLRSRMAANEASAVGSVRSVVVAQVTYSVAYPKRSYAPSLAMLGPEPHHGKTVSAEYAGLLNETLVNSSCTADGWCTKSGFRFRVSAACKGQLCKEYVVVATPVDSNSGARNFCATSDGVIRFKAGEPLAAPISAVECQAWKPL
jgi:hypothetical protein